MSNRHAPRLVTTGLQDWLELECTSSDVMAIECNRTKYQIVDQSLMLLLNKYVLLWTIRLAPRLVTTQLQDRLGLECTTSDAMVVQWNRIKCQTVDQSLMLVLNNYVYLNQNLVLLWTIRHAPRLVTNQLQDRLGLVSTTSDVMAIECNRMC